MPLLLDTLLALPADFPGLTPLAREVVYLMGCRDFNQFCCTWRGLVDPTTFCPFCSSELTRRGRSVLGGSSDWIVLRNEFPRPDVQAMLLIVPTKHVTEVGDLTDDDYGQIGSLFSHCRKNLGCSSGGLVMRYGDPRDHAGTIEHLHINVNVPTREMGMSVPLAKRLEGPYGHREDYVRMKGFVTRAIEYGGTDWLFSDNGVIETQPPCMA